MKNLIVKLPKDYLNNDFQEKFTRYLRRALDEEYNVVVMPEFEMLVLSDDKISNIEVLKETDFEKLKELIMQ